jgi:molybdate transport system regulatory protein
MKLRIDINLEITPELSLNRKEIFLLEFIRKTGSLSHAARKLKMSYKTAWTLISKLNTTGEFAFTQACAGGVAGGKTTLTPYALRILAKYKKLLEKLRLVARQEEKQNPF